MQRTPDGATTTLQRSWDLLVAGALWGALGTQLGHRAFNDVFWPATLASPLIGLAVGATLQHRFEGAGGWRRAWIALASLYLGTAMFGLVMGMAALVTGGPGLSEWTEVLLAPILVVWWGVTLTGFLLFLWPLAYATHWLLEFRGTR